VYSTRLHVCTRASLTDNLARILARKSARVGRVGGQVGEDRRACPARGKLNGESPGAAARRLPSDDPRAELGEDVRVGVRVGPTEFQLYAAACALEVCGSTILATRPVPVATVLTRTRARPVPKISTRTRPDPRVYPYP